MTRDQSEIPHQGRAGNQALPRLEFVNRIARNAHVRSYVLDRLLRAHEYDFTHLGRIASITGDHISDIIRRNGRYEELELRIIESLILSRLPCTQLQCLDVGANIGNHTLFFSRRFSQVIAFEPNAVACTLLELNLTMNEIKNVELHAVGLSDQAGTARLSVRWANIGGGYVRGLAQPPRNAASHRRHETDIELMPGDSLLDPEAPIGFVKIDVEGMECHVLRGLDRTIDRHLPVLMLEQLARVVDEKTGTTEATALLETKGYRPFEIRRITRSRVKLIDHALTYLFGHNRYALSPILTFEKKSYDVVIYLTDDHLRRLGGQS